MSLTAKNAKDSQWTQRKEGLSCCPKAYKVVHNRTINTTCSFSQKPKNQLLNNQKLQWQTICSAKIEIIQTDETDVSGRI
jgi:hypothetical protein